MIFETDVNTVIELQLQTNKWLKKNEKEPVTNLLQNDPRWSYCETVGDFFRSLDIDQLKRLDADKKVVLESNSRLPIADHIIYRCFIREIEGEVMGIRLPIIDIHEHCIHSLYAVNKRMNRHPSVSRQVTRKINGLTKGTREGLFIWNYQCDTYEEYESRHTKKVA